MQPRPRPSCYQLVIGAVLTMVTFGRLSPMRLSGRVAASDSQSPRPERRPATCAHCAAPLTDDQRYCLACGVRRGPVPVPVAGLITGLTGAARDGQAPAESEVNRWFTWPDLSSVTPRIAAVSVMAMLAFGVVVGSGASSLADSGGRSLLLALSRPGTSAPAVASTSASGGGGGGGGGGGSNAGPTIVTQTVTAQTVTAPGAGGGGGGGGGGGSPATPAGPTLPPIKHVFEIVLSGQGYNQTYGPTSPLPYLAKTLKAQGELLQNYYGVASSPLSNAVALLSGQGPNPQTAADCPQYTAFKQTGTGQEQQALGSGCVYPVKTQTLADQLTASGLTWKGYIESMKPGAAMASSATTSSTSSPVPTATTTSSPVPTATTTSSPTASATTSATTTSGTSTGSAGASTGASCRHPALGASDPNSSPSATDPYVTYR
ncbi:MAG: phosphatidylinositol-3-phosphatase, partial [Solirubrobacteraceae bacterium]|nr:phosphatidylinositol-3-phosphatase [Solirubrobacteraceae bacterium]